MTAIGFAQPDPLRVDPWLRPEAPTIAPAGRPPGPATTPRPAAQEPAQAAPEPGLIASLFSGLFGGETDGDDKEGGIGALLGGAAGKLATGGEWARESLPGLIAAPVGGSLGALSGLATAGQGLVSDEDELKKSGLEKARIEALSTVGLGEALGETWGQHGGLPSGLEMPPGIAGEIADVRTQVPEDAHMNGMHSWHAGTNAALANRLGPAAALPLWLAGLVHESPIDKESFDAEQQYQGTVNHILDSSMDIVSNTLGIGLGLALPKEQAIKAAILLGNNVPGPGDPDPEFGGDGAYKGKPQDAWGQTPKR